VAAVAAVEAAGGGGSSLADGAIDIARGSDTAPAMSTTAVYYSAAKAALFARVSQSNPSASRRAFRSVGILPLHGRKKVFHWVIVGGVSLLGRMP
jgi:hypothetical protein